MVGYISVYRTEKRAFDNEQVSLLQSFAAQAVIAMENARLLTETREALEQQTATAEVLEVINASPGDLAPVFEAMLDRAIRLCGAVSGHFRTYDGQGYPLVAVRGDPDHVAHMRQRGTFVSRGAAPAQPLSSRGRCDSYARCGAERGVSGDPGFRGVVDSSGSMAMLSAALRKDGALLGYVSVYRPAVGAFSSRQIALLQNFAAQAVIAMENARLIAETREALEQQTATAEVLGVINASPGDVKPVFEAMLDKAMRLSGAACGGLFTYDGEAFHQVATRMVPQALAEFRAQHPPASAATQRVRLMMQTRRPVHTLDVTETDAYRTGDMHDRAMADLGGARTILNVPLVKDDAVVGFISVYRTEKRAFDERQVALLESFAAQAVIAMENARLLSETREALERQTATAEVLRAISASPGDVKPVFEAMLDNAIG